MEKKNKHMGRPKLLHGRTPTEIEELINSDESWRASLSEEAITFFENMPVHLLMELKALCHAGVQGEFLHEIVEDVIDHALSKGKK